LYIIQQYKVRVKTERPQKSAEHKQSDSLLIRLRATEKEGFQLCADLAGISLSSWVRERLRFAAIRDLETAGRSIPFVEDIPLGDSK